MRAACNALCSVARQPIVSRAAHFSAVDTGGEQSMIQPVQEVLC